MTKNSDKEIIKLFRLEEVIDMLIDYDVKHFEIDTQPVFGEFLYGYIDFYNKDIYINSKLDYQSARETIIHEFIHGLKDKYSIPDKEKDTERQARKIYKLLYSNYHIKHYPYLLKGDKDGNEK